VGNSHIPAGASNVADRAGCGVWMSSFGMVSGCYGRDLGRWCDGCVAL
jgi:hypothetical protein